MMSPHPVDEAMQIEIRAFQNFKNDHDTIVRAYHRDLKLALDRQAELILEYELRLAGNDVQQRAAVQERIVKLKAELQKQLDAHTAGVSQAGNNYMVAIKIHNAVKQYLTQEFDEASLFELTQTIVREGYIKHIND